MRTKHQETAQKDLLDKAKVLYTDARNLVQSGEYACEYAARFYLDATVCLNTVDCLLTCSDEEFNYFLVFTCRKMTDAMRRGFVGDMGSSREMMDYLVNYFQEEN